MTNRFRHKIGEEYSSNLATIIRWQKTLEFIGETRTFRSALDIGDRTGLTEMMEMKFEINFENTNMDLDKHELFGKYDLVTSFEVLEHLFNPLFNLEQIHKVLEPGGCLILSTPLAKPRFLWSETHFHEMSKKSIQVLFETAGFEIKRQGFFRVHPLSFYITGIRPLLRLFLEKIQIYELVPVDS